MELIWCQSSALGRTKYSPEFQMNGVLLSEVFKTGYRKRPELLPYCSWEGEYLIMLLEFYLTDENSPPLLERRWSALMFLISKGEIRL
mmetsp:Transcript_20325/g.49909  ORF Transcript_20325/g.49909 Transcript_20325/m.49909 type:complete len:88 (+) Transcript_20325:1222-1485(+)